jgi:hypothetical protein
MKLGYAAEQYLRLLRHREGLEFFVGCGDHTPIILEAQSILSSENAGTSMISKSQEETEVSVRLKKNLEA